ncbi:hypothetical protein LX76_01015 [Cereibacter changlensis]|uniref:Uncharacterized protein n=1 Tax=Cereibacter changlensis TaxID=402884 RepID=A0A2W7RGJ4_9RHOB|nr:hypothetical protein [Cereibacter changlensis]PZX57470.1 hypothetical protein LX76_01015 [Cereibacter changlensis]
MTLAFSALSGLVPAASAVALVVSGSQRARARRRARGGDRSTPYTPPAHLTAPMASAPRMPAAARNAGERPAKGIAPASAPEDTGPAWNAGGGASKAEVRNALLSWLGFFAAGALLFGIAALWR